MRLVRLLLCLFFLAAFASVSYPSEDIIDLGEIGFSCPRDFKKSEKSLPLTLKNNVYLNPINLAYKSKLPEHTGPSETRHLSFKKNLNTPIGARIFVFSCYDAQSIKLASKLDFDYGLCIEYKSLADLDDFRKQAGIKQPVQIANDEIVEYFKISSYPALITVKEDEFEIQEGF